MVSPAFLLGNNTTMATTPVPKRIRINVPRNSAKSSAASVGFPFIADSPRINLNQECIALSQEGYSKTTYTLLLGIRGDSLILQRRFVEPLGIRSRLAAWKH